MKQHRQQRQVIRHKLSDRDRVQLLSFMERQAEISAAPVYYRDAAGVYRPIDTTVRPVSEPGFVAGNGTNVFTIGNPVCGFLFGRTPLD